MIYLACIALGIAIGLIAAAVILFVVSGVADEIDKRD